MSTSKDELERLTERVVVLEQEQSTIYKKLYSVFFDGEPSLQTLPAAEANDLSPPQMQQADAPAKLAKAVSSAANSGCSCLPNLSLSNDLFAYQQSRK